MATLSSASTDAEVWDAYDDNVSYDTDGSVAKCKVFIEACRILRRRNPKLARTGNRNELQTFDFDSELKAATTWLSANGGFPVVSDAVGSVKHLSLEGFRD